MPGVMLLIYRTLAIPYLQTCSFLIQQVYSFTTGTRELGTSRKNQAA